MSTMVSRAEENRVKAAYDKRDESIPENFYSLLKVPNLLRVQELERKLARVLTRSEHQPVTNKKILEVGCGCGLWLIEFLRMGARPENLAGVDLLEERIADAKQLLPRAATLRCGNSELLDFPDGSFDIVFQSMLFSSILNRKSRRQIASEMLRVLAPGGTILWYDFFLNNPFNADVQGLRKKDIAECFPNCRIQLGATTLAPPLARSVSRNSAVLYWLLSAVPFLRSHYFGSITPRKPVS
ncbi:MAG TPA: class I SAM-dependent methyltransferase [Terriglobales bacterium]|nr:class I SAM-dependent methyltransferase [Terriglobales bacterium]